MSPEETLQETPVQKLVLDFLTDYFYCTLTQDRLADRCRQFTRETDASALRPLLDETLRLCSEISARFPNLDAKASNLLARLQELGDRNDGFMNDIAEAMGYRGEDRSMADDFSLCVLTKEIGQNRVPRQRVLVNPFTAEPEIPEEKEVEEEEVIPEEEDPPEEPEEEATEDEEPEQENGEESDGP